MFSFAKLTSGAEATARGAETATGRWSRRAIAMEITTPVAVRRRGFAVEIPEVIGEGQHKILLKNLGIGIFDISIRNTAVYALILVQDIKSADLDLGGIVFQEFGSERGIP